MDPTSPTPAQRAADADREAAADTLRQAGGDGRLSLEELEERLHAVYAAKTHPELDALLADLRGRQELTSAPRTTGSTAEFAVSRRAFASRPGIGQTSRVGETASTVAIMGENRRRGFWRPAADGRVLTVMGEATIDLTEADLSRPVTRLRVLTVMGQTAIEVPDDVNVFVTRLTIMAHTDVDVPDEPLPGAPELHIQLVSIMAETRLRLRRRRERRSDVYA